MCVFVCASTAPHHTTRQCSKSLTHTLSLTFDIFIECWIWPVYFCNVHCCHLIIFFELIELTSISLTIEKKEHSVSFSFFFLNFTKCVLFYTRTCTFLIIVYTLYFFFICIFLWCCNFIYNHWPVSNAVTKSK